MIEIKKPDNQTRDYQKFFIIKPDSDFSPERNKYIVEKSIEKYERKRREQAKKYNERIAERTEAVYSYLKHLDKGHDTPIEKYFSKRTLAYLRGQHILQTIRPDGSILLDYVDY